MSDDLRDILGIGSKKMPIMSVPLLKSLVAVGNEGANKGFWRIQLRDQSGNWVQMGGAVTFEVDLPDLGKVFGTGTYQGYSKDNPNEIIIRVKDHPKLPDGDYNIPPDNLEESAEAIIPAEALARLVKKDEGVSIEQMEAEAAQAEQAVPDLKDEITGDEAMQVVRNAGAEYAKSQGRFPMARTYNDIKQGLRSQYSQLLEGIKQDTPELLKNQFILNEDGTGRFGDIKTDGDFWGAIEAMKVNTGNRWVAPDGINPLAKEVNRRYAEKFLGLKKDGLISFYRNVIQEKDIPAEAAAGYASLDKKMAWDYNSQMSGSTEVNRGRYIVKAKPDEVLGILGLSGAVDEFGVVISPEVTGLPGRFERVGNLEKQRIDTAPWVDYEELDKESRIGGNSPFRFLAPMTNFDYYALDSSPFGEEGTWASFIKTNNLPDKSVSKKYDEIYGAGSWEKDWKGSNPTARVYADLFVKFTDKDGKEKWGLNAPNLRNLSTTDMLNFAEPGDDFDRGIKLLSTMQELMGKPFFVSKGHSKEDPRLAEVEQSGVEVPGGDVEFFDDGESKGSKLIDAAIESGDIDYKLLPESTIESNFDRKDIPTEQDQALFAYSMSTFLDINAYLRNDEVSILSTKQYLDGHIANLDKLIDEKGDVLEEAVVYRGTSAEKDSPNHILLESIQEGDIVEDLAYSSTTKSPKVAFEAFGPSNQKYEGVQTKTNTPSNRGGNSSFWMVTLPVGSKALAKPADEYGHSHEKEVLLPRGSKFRINAIRKVEQVGQNGKKNGNFNYFIDATVVPDSAVETKESEQSGVEVPGGDVEFFDDSEKPKGSGLTVNGRSELREIKRRLGGEIFDTTAIKLIEQYSGSDDDVKKLDAALTKKGIYRKRDLFTNAYVDAVRSAISDYKKIDPNLNIKREAKKAEYGSLNGTGLGVIGYLQAGTLTRFDNFDFSYASDKDKLSAAREEIIKNGFVNPITILYNQNRDDFTLENPEDSLKILATREIKDPDIKIRAIPTVVKVSAESDSFDKDTELNPVFFYELSQPSAWVADIQVKPEEYYDLSGIDSLPVPSRTDAEKEAIDFYQRGTYLTLKKYLADPSSAGDDAEKLGKIVDTLNKLGNSEKLPANTELFRGFRLSADSNLYKYYSSLKSGDVLADPNRFGSTSLDPIVAEDFATLGGKKDDYTGSVVLEISTEEGATGVVFGDNEDTYASGLEVVLASEKEVLLPLAAQLKIDKIFKDSDGILRIQAKYGKKVELESKSDAADQDFIDFSSFEKVSGRLGHTDGGKYKDPKTGKEYYVKIQDGKRGANEALASALYNEAGIDSIRVKNGVLDGTPITYTEWRGDLAPISERISNITSDDPALDGFAIDAWLANWDTVGAGDFGGYNNISYDKDGNPVRIDAGGALLYRGAGLRKGSTFGNEVGELETFKNTNFTTGELFSKITYETELASVDRLRKITPERIDELVDQYVSDSDDNKELKDKLKARREFILSKYEPTSEAEQSDESDPFGEVEWFDDEQPVSTSKVLGNLVKDGIVNLDAIPDSTILSKFTVDDIPEDQRRSLSTYSGSDYQVINNLLRFGPESAYTPTENINKLVKNLDDLIESKGTVESDSVVFRGMIETERYEDSDVLMSEMLDGLKPGDVISDPAFLSTSSDKNVALRKFGPGNMTDEGSKLDASNPVYQSSSFWVIKVPEGSKAFATPEKGFGYASVEKEVILPRNTQLRIDGIKKVAQEEEGGENGEFNYYIEASVVPVSKDAEPLDPPRIDLMKDWDSLTGLETSAEKQERIEPGFENWNKEVEKIFEDWDNDLIVGVETYDDGNILQANFIKKAGFNEKPKVLSQEEFDAIEGETVYRGHQSTSFMNGYINSELQYAGEGYFGNGTYTSNRRDTAENYAGNSGPDSATKAEIEERILEMKMLPDANVLSFEEVTDLREWADQKTREFLEGYEKSGANPAQYQEAEWRLFNEADYTNIAIMLGIDAIRFAVPLTDKEEYYTIILNRGKVAINGKS